MSKLERMVERVRFFTRLSAFLVFLLLSMATLGLVRIIEFCSRQRIDRTVLVNVYSAGLCRLLGMRIQTRGLVMEGPALRVCNHVSWTDIPILAAGLPLRFLAKREVASWPIIGWIAREIGTIFVRRGAGDSAKVRQTLVSALEGGSSVVVFPEGTTTTGAGVKRFHPHMLGAAIEAKCPVQAITIAYHRDGQRDWLVPFTGDDDFVAHLCRLLKKPAVRMDVLYHPPVTVSASDNPADLAQLFHQQVSQGLVTLREEYEPAAARRTPLNHKESATEPG
ncbi:MAG: lysophospholipid acyltransferase family protein [Marinobacter sp.]|uniref:lysophospholipid acyltransferase family protein n=2 Tax=unclassified Marinobacter TaxID=83889 RepID=UPI00273B12BE|nr:MULTISPECIES: lysophospholipid acyltransferase family protein [unclassified Marinobacter]MDP4549241.1 lysophospholipid acyltransferase family protein [Marinobacter sp. MDS2]